MAAFTVQNINRPGIVPVGEVANGGGDSFSNTGNEFLLIENGDGSPTTVTVITSETRDGGAVQVQDLAVTAVPATDKVLVGPFDTATYGTTTSLTYTSVTSLVVSVLRLS